ncbi:hypothetical protein [Embleya sp. NPDC059259]|uniref:hypothetical protein n=1 Tax=unclassified Embleya TaxID=2699296 RepID=UPI0036C6B29D
MHITQWMAYSALPAYGFAMFLAFYATICARTPRQRLMSAVGRLVLGLGGIVLIPLPSLASIGAPPPEGGGSHYDGWAAEFLPMSIGLLLTCTTAVSLSRACKRRYRARTARNAFTV